MQYDRLYTRGVAQIDSKHSLPSESGVGQDAQTWILMLLNWRIKSVSSDPYGKTVLKSKLESHVVIPTGPFVPYSVGDEIQIKYLSFSTSRDSKLSAWTDFKNEISR